MVSRPLLLALFLLARPSLSAEPTVVTMKPAKTAALLPTELAAVPDLPPAAQTLLERALELTRKNLSYRSASADPSLGGMDCSGTIYYLLQSCGIAATPRQSNEMYAWTWQERTFRATNSRSLTTFEWAELRPADLVFWVNSTADGQTDRDPPVTHVMLYLGRRKSDSQQLLFGASDGRTYQGQSQCGVSVFDFKLPGPESPSRIIGYARIPGLAMKP
jgi:cell wall-associated NlpC family hydrolase